MHKDNYNKLSDKIEKLNFHNYKERMDIQKNLESLASNSNDALKANGNLLKVIITLQVLNLSKEIPAIAAFLKLIS